MWGLLERDEELGAVGVPARICAGEQVLLVVFESEVLVGKLGTVDTFSASSITFRKVATLGHEAANNAME